MELGDSLLIGKIVGVHGIKGALKIHCYTDSLDIFTVRKEVWIEGRDGAFNRISIETIMPYKKGALFKFPGICDRDAAENMIGRRLFIDKRWLPELEDDEYYWKDLIGLDVWDAKSGACIGRLEAIIETGSNDVFVVKTGNKELLIPAIGSVVKSVDIGDSIMRVEIPEGLG